MQWPDYNTAKRIETINTILGKSSIYEGVAAIAWLVFPGLIIILLTTLGVTEAVSNGAAFVVWVITGFPLAKLITILKEAKSYAEKEKQEMIDDVIKKYLKDNVLYISHGKNATFKIIYEGLKPIELHHKHGDSEWKQAGRHVCNTDSINELIWHATGVAVG